MSSVNEGAQRPTLDALDPLTSLRFVAAIIVVMFHVALRHFAPGSLAASVLGRGWIAVYFFFTLSGFVMGVAYAASTISAPRFWVLRVFRIWPLHLFALLCLVHFGIVDTRARFGDENKIVLIGSVVLLLHGWTPYWSALNFPSWSLSTEAFFYAVFPALNRGLRRIAKPSTLLAIGFAFVVLQLAIVLTPAAAGATCPHGVECTSTFQKVMATPLGSAGFFIVGVVLGRIFIDEHRRGVQRPGNLYFLVGFVALVAVFALDLDHWDGLVARAATMIPFAVIVYGAAHSSGVVRRVLAARPLVYLGDISYSIYLLQLPALYFIGHLVLHRPTMFSLSVADTILYFATLLAASSLTHRFIESPFRNLGRRLAGTGSRSAPGR